MKNGKVRSVPTEPKIIQRSDDSLRSLRLSKLRGYGSPQVPWFIIQIPF